MRKANTLDVRSRIEFESKALPADTFTVIRFSGQEALSSVYRFEIELISEKADLSLDSVLTHVASLKIVQGEQQTRFNGVLAEFEELHQKDGDTFYRAVLVPRLWQLSLYRVNEVYVDKSTPDVIRRVLEEAGFTSLDYEFALTATYTPWTHLCEYQESHLDFISRLMERDGLYYYFAQDEGREKVVITDAKSRHEVLTKAGAIRYEPASGLLPDPDKQVLLSLICRQKPLPKKLVVMDYNYRKPSLELKTEVVVDPSGRGDVYLYGEHADDQAESKILAEIRAQELRCRKRSFHGESTVSLLRAGYLSDVTGHFRADFNQRYLLVEVTHEGSQAGAVLSSNSDTQAGGEQAAFYRNTFSAIAAEVQFRPERVTPKPRIHGTMNAVIDAEGSGTHPELDEHGRYKVCLPLDRASHGDAKASQWVRMATPYAGQDHGMHFPLRKGTEVLLTFIDGDPNRPIIAGAVPNMDKPSVVNQATQERSVVRVRGGMETIVSAGTTPQFAGIGADAAAETPIAFNSTRWEKEAGWDVVDGLYFAINKAAGITYDVTCNEGNSIEHNKGHSISRTLGNSIEQTGTARQPSNSSSLTYGNSTEETHGNSTSKTWGDSDEETHGNSNSKTWGDSTEETHGDSKSTTRGNSKEDVWGNAQSSHMGASEEYFFGQQLSIALSNETSLTLGLSEELKIGGGIEISIAGTIEAGLFDTVEFDLKTMKVKVDENKVAINELNAAVFDTTTAANGVETKVSKIQTLANKITTSTTAIDTALTKLKSGATDIDTTGIKIL